MEKTSSQSESLKVKVWGCRGSIANSGKRFLDHGGNTTCFEVLSSCLPPGIKWFIDAGTGFVPAGYAYLSEMKNGLEYVVSFTHYHYDHILGLTLAPPTFIPDIKMTFLGPKDQGMSPGDVIRAIFRRPFFPVDAGSIRSKMTFKTLRAFDVTVIVVHPAAGWATFNLEEFTRLDRPRGQISINKMHCNINECLVIRMGRANHGNSTCITYRFEERPTGKVLVICTDHEDYAEIPKDILRHFHHADLLIIDAQYDQEQYGTRTAGYGHGTPHGVVRQGMAANVKRILITHHDPLLGTDEYLRRQILAPARHEAQGLLCDPEFQKRYGINGTDAFRLMDGDHDGIALCKDYETYNV